MVNAQEWLEKKYPDKEIGKIYINQQLEGVLDCREYKNLEHIFISSIVDISKFEIKKQFFWIIPCVSAKTYLNQEYPTLENREKEVEYLRISWQIYGTLDLTDFTNLKNIYISRNVDTKLFEIINKSEQTKIILNSWIDINLFFAENYKNSNETCQQKWEKAGFTYEEVKEWFGVWGGIFPTEEFEFYDWLKSRKKIDSVWVLNNVDPNDFNSITEVLKKLAMEYSLSKGYGLCSECQQPNTSTNWCQVCNAKRFQQDFDKWTSGNLEIDELIQKSQLEASNWFGLLEWIPYEEFKEIKFLVEGGFSKIYKAEREKGIILKWNEDEKKWKRGSNTKFVLKVLDCSSQNITKEFLQEIRNYKIVNQRIPITIVPYFGISQEPETKNFIMVSLYMNEGNLREFLRNHNNKWEFKDKFESLAQIALALSEIHFQNLMHKDFHSGNLLVNKNKDSNFILCITDLGLSRPAGSTDEEQIFGVIPYVAPEVLQGQPYTQAADIYSFGIVAYELFANSYPYPKMDDINLILQVCQGYRPDIGKIPFPQLLKDLIKKCWNADPKKRPTASELVDVLVLWYDEERFKGQKTYDEFQQQYQTIKGEYNTFSQNTPYQIHPQAITTSKAINTKQITELLKTYSEDLVFDFTKLNLEDQEQPLQTQIQIPPK